MSTAEQVLTGLTQAHFCLVEEARGAPAFLGQALTLSCCYPTAPSPTAAPRSTCLPTAAQDLCWPQRLPALFMAWLSPDAGQALKRPSPHSSPRSVGTVMTSTGEKADGDGL